MIAITTARETTPVGEMRRPISAASLGGVVSAEFFRLDAAASASARVTILPNTRTPGYWKGCRIPSIRPAHQRTLRHPPRKSQRHATSGSLSVAEVSLTRRFSAPCRRASCIFLQRGHPVVHSGKPMSSFCPAGSPAGAARGRSANCHRTALIRLPEAFPAIP